MHTLCCCKISSWNSAGELDIHRQILFPLLFTLSLEQSCLQYTLSTLYCLLQKVIIHAPRKSGKKQSGLFKLFISVLRYHKYHNNGTLTGLGVYENVDVIELMSGSVGVVQPEPRWCRRWKSPEPQYSPTKNRRNQVKMLVVHLKKVLRIEVLYNKLGFYKVSWFSLC